MGAYRKNIEAAYIKFIVYLLIFISISLGLNAMDDQKLPAEFGHFVPEEKGLSAEYMKSLLERGERQVWKGEDLYTIGMPVGGIATGQLYLCGDGTLALWWIFNKHIFTGTGQKCYRTYKPDKQLDSGFAVVIESDSQTSIKRLNQEDFPGVEFLGEYPIGIVRYAQDDYPLKIEMEAFSPFIPINARDSALPATLFHITLENTSDKSVKAGVLAWLENAVCFYSAETIPMNRHSQITTKKRRTMIVHTAEEIPVTKKSGKPRSTILLADFEGDDYGDWKVEGDAFGESPASGTLPKQQSVSGFVGKGLVNTYLEMDKPHGKLTSPPFKIKRKFINFLIGGGKHKGETCINLLIDKNIVRTATGENNEHLDWHSWDVQEFENKEARIEIVDSASGSWGHINIDHIELADAPHTEPIEKLSDYGSMVLALSEKGMQADKILALGCDWMKEIHSEKDFTYPCTDRKSTAMMTPFEELAPNTKRTFTFVLTWFFPNSEDGHEYSNRFKSAKKVAHYVLKNHEHLAGETRLWHKTFYEDSTLPRWLLFRLHSTVCNLATGTCQWWANDRFWAWEGVGCCGGTCTHVWNYAQADARLFPELTRIVREMQDFGAGFDEKTGLVGFRSNRAYAADGQCGTILKAYREHTMSPDNTFLKHNWTKIKKALQFSIDHDQNKDGFIEDSQHNTYDINFQGPNTFVGSLYLAALRAGEEMAREMGEDEFADECHRIFESGKKLTIENLWNGEYFIQLVDLKEYPKYQYGEGCLSDQLFGQGWAHQLALGYIYPKDKVKSAYKSIWKYNWTPDVGPQNYVHNPERWFARPGEAGLFTCTWPKSEYLENGVRYRNEVWTGIEYQVAGGMVWEGMVEEALAICRGIQDRYHPSRHNPFNEVECGDHYARALASWGVYNALLGYEYNGPKGYLGFAPKLLQDDFKAAFTVAEGWGLFTQKRNGKEQTSKIEIRQGKLRIRKLVLEIPDGLNINKIEARVKGKAIKVSSVCENGRLILTFKPITLTKKKVLEIKIQKI